MADLSLTCKNCHQLLSPDPSISHLTPSTYSLISGALPTPSAPSNLNPASKLAALPPSSQAGARIYAKANGLSTWDPAQRHGQAPGGVAESFILLSESTLHQPSASTSVSPVNTGTAAGPSRTGYIASPAGRTQLADDLHVLLSERTAVSHPLCTDCTALLQTGLSKKLDELTRQRDAYEKFEKGIETNRAALRKGRRKSSSAADRLGEYDIEGDEAEWEELQKQKAMLQAEEARLRIVLQDKEKELEAAQEAEQRAKAEEEAVERQEEEFLLSHAKLSTNLTHLQHQLQTSKTHLLLSKSLLSHLESTNVYADAFQIGHVPLNPATDPSGKTGLNVGTINGLRLGGRPEVDWDELNAAWGLVALCLDRLAKKVGCEFTGCKIVPLGSYTKIEDLPPSKNSYELYGSSEFSPARLLQNRRFNHALVSLLDLLRQLIEYGRRTGKPWSTGNIEIHKDKIQGHSIRLPGVGGMGMGMGIGIGGWSMGASVMGFGGGSGSALGTGEQADSSKKDKEEASGEEQWTRACRAVLAVLKRIINVESETDRATVQEEVKGLFPAQSRAAAAR